MIRLLPSQPLSKWIIVFQANVVQVQDSKENNHSGICFFNEAPLHRRHSTWGSSHTKMLVPSFFSPPSFLLKQNQVNLCYTPQSTSTSHHKMHLFEVILFGALLLAAVASLSHGAPASASRNDQGGDDDDDDDSDNDNAISTKTLGGGEEGDDVGTVVKVAS